MEPTSSPQIPLKHSRNFECDFWFTSIGSGSGIFTSVPLTPHAHVLLALNQIMSMHESERPGSSGSENPQSPKTKTAGEQNLNQEVHYYSNLIDMYIVIVPVYGTLVSSNFFHQVFPGRYLGIPCLAPESREIGWVVGCTQGL